MNLRILHHNCLVLHVSEFDRAELVEGATYTYIKNDLKGSILYAFFRNFAACPFILEVQRFYRDFDANTYPLPTHFIVLRQHDELG